MIGLIPGGQGSLSHDTHTAFQLILSSEGSEGSPRPPANFFVIFSLILIMSSVGSGSLLCRVIDPRLMSAVKKSPCTVIT